METSPTGPHKARNARKAQDRCSALTRQVVRQALRRVWPLVAASLLAACATPAPDAQPPGVPQPGAVSVTYADPGGFAEARSTPREPEKVRRAWLDALALHLAERAAPRLREGQRLQVQITDVQRAGGFEPWRGPQAGEVRIVRDIYPPRIDLHFKLTGPGGSVQREGSRQLRDSGFLMRPGGRSSDPLQHEKALLDDWVDKEFARRG